MQIRGLALVPAVVCGAPAAAQMVAPVAPVPPPSSIRPAIDGRPVPIGLVDAVGIGLRDNRTIRAGFVERTAQRFALAAAERRFGPRLDLLADIYHAETGGQWITESAVGGAGSWLLPTGAQIGFVWDRRDRLDGDGASESASLVMTQPLLRGGGIAVNRAPVRIARLQDAIDRLALRNMMAETISRIVFAYRALQQTQEQIRLAEIALERTGDLIETNRAMIEAGRMAAADIVQTEADYANQEVALFQARQERSSAQLALLELLAVDPGTNIVASDAIDAERVPIDLNRAIGIASDSRMDLLAQRRAVGQARERLRVAENNRLWDVSVVAAATRIAGRDPLLGDLPSQTDGRVGLQLTIPLGDPAPDLAAVRAETGLRTAEIRLEALDQAVETQVRDAAQRVEASWLRLESARRFKALAARAVSLEREKLAAGRSTNFQLLSLQDDLRVADIQALGAAISYLNALTAFDLQIGATLASWDIEWIDR